MVMREHYMLDGNNLETSKHTHFFQIRSYLRYGKEKRKAKYNNDQSTWQYYKYLNFLDPHMVDRQSTQSPSRKESVDVVSSWVISHFNFLIAQQVAVTDPNWGVSLIDEVRIHPCLFDIRDAKYRHSDCRNQAWQDVIKALNFPGWFPLSQKLIMFRRRKCHLQAVEKIERSLRKGETSNSWAAWPWGGGWVYLGPLPSHGLDGSLFGWAGAVSFDFCSFFLFRRYEMSQFGFSRHVKRKHDPDAWSDGELDEIRAESGLGYTGMVEKRAGGGDK